MVLFQEVGLYGSDWVARQLLFDWKWCHGDFDEVIMDGTRYIFAASGELKEKKDLNVGWIHRDGKRYFFNNREEQVGTEHAKKIWY